MTEMDNNPSLSTKTLSRSPNSCIHSQCQNSTVYTTSTTYQQQLLSTSPWATYRTTPIYSLPMRG
eukprot:scaffold3446_cov134-Amphora_coffeaeformis.AAC.1